MLHFIPGRRGYAKAAMAALLLGVLAACGGGGKTAKPSEADNVGTVVQLSPADNVAAKQREKRRQAAVEAREQTSLIEQLEAR